MAFRPWCPDPSEPLAATLPPPSSARGLPALPLRLAAALPPLQALTARKVRLRSSFANTSRPAMLMQKLPCCLQGTIGAIMGGLELAALLA
jgi:hypothetical protein